MKTVNFLSALALGGLLLTTGCQDKLLDQVNPNAPSTSTFFKTANDALLATNACYDVFHFEGSYGRWLHFDYDLRSDEGFSNSPWTDLANSTRFVILDYNFVTNASPWTEVYRGVYRCNQVLAYVPNIDFGSDTALKNRLLGEAHFVRALYYWNLVTLWGNVPLADKPGDATTRYPQATTQQIWDFIIADLKAAETALPVSYTGNDVGRATKGAAQTLMGKAYMQQRKWSDAQAQFAKVISSGTYALVPNYEDNFNVAGENNKESIFEIGFTDALQGDGQDVAGSSQGCQRAQFFGARQVGWCDGQPRKWLYNEFNETTLDGKPDPRRDVTLISYPMLVYGKTYEQRYADPTTGNFDKAEVFWRKYQNDKTRNYENYFSPIDFRVMRYADVLLMQAEALNEQGQPAAAIPLINQVRARVNLAPLAVGTYDQAGLRTRLLHERVTELCGENTRWTDLQRSGLLDSQAGVSSIAARDPDFVNFVVGKNMYLPIPLSETSLDPALKQNPGY
ncbi:RagB/SusD family nutrient uptake outer membrane protein [Hymenobacter sp. RP-2-7]|uniref:RagB/SusD family nutrient uptake outer membrane protein n=1 Tax=Hymenobacter polaris TaxID=2682546 RepID=A0A7Y0FME1_9BACT|nr:RagB/SusD family nutrient uptake outer membrane protein [Hymenobacter polaris]NML65416.1 RagB/SusD family nutrient uptake outer membrane protein [Hymenobacter polaris]